MSFCNAEHKAEQENSRRLSNTKCCKLTQDLGGTLDKVDVTERINGVFGGCMCKSNGIACFCLL